MDDIGVPTAPMLVPSATAAQLSVKWESKMADGTLLITWLLINAVGTPQHLHQPIQEGCHCSDLGHVTAHDEEADKCQDQRVIRFREYIAIDNRQSGHNHQRATT